MTLEIGFLVFPGFQMLDLSGPLGAFEIASSLVESRPYKLRTVSRHGGVVESSVGLSVVAEPVDACGFDTFIVVGGSGHQPPDDVQELAQIALQCSRASRRVASICTGAFVLAEAGLLDGREATTHWRHSATLQRLYPKVSVDGDRIFTHDGMVWTSAGITAGIDLALALIEDDLGSEVADDVARMLVVYQHRSGGQLQFAKLSEVEPESERIRRALEFARSHLHEKLPVERLAEVAGLGTRQFSRAFQQETGETPAKAIERLRAEFARRLLEEGKEAIEGIALQTGFSDPERMRRAFIRIFGHPPQSVRRISRAS